VAKRPTPPELRTAFGVAVRRLRLARKLSIYAFAQRAGLSEVMVCDCENGKVGPSLYSIVLLAEAFGLTVVQLMQEVEFPGGG
jgi:transcriptional regulator with XRE-family HTH domain